MIALVGFRRFIRRALVALLIVSLVMVVLSNNIVTAFGLMAVFAIVRFRNILRDTLDTSFVLSSIFVGMACGTQKFSTTLVGALIILAMMILPFIASVMRDVFEIVPPVLKESAYGIGCTTWEVVKNVVLPYTKAGVIGGVMLGLGRALGETMAVTFVIGNSQRLSASLFAPGTSIASTLANEFGEAEAGNHLSSLFALGLALFIITFIVLACAKLMLSNMEKKQGLKS